MFTFIHRAAQLLSLGLLFQSRGSEAELRASVHWLTQVSDYQPVWAITANPEYTNLLGTYQTQYPPLASAYPYYFSAFLFNESAQPAYRQEIGNWSCEIQPEAMNVLYLTDQDAYYLYLFSGDQCPIKDQLHLTHLKLSPDSAPQELRTITIPELSGPAEIMMRDYPYQRSHDHKKQDRVISHYQRGQDQFTVTRADVALNQATNQLTQLNFTSMVYDFALANQSTSTFEYDLSKYLDRRLIDWYYKPPYLLIAAVSANGLQISLDWYKDGEMLTETALDTSDPNSIFYEVTAHAYNDSALLISARVVQIFKPAPQLRQFYISSVDGQATLLSNETSRELLSVLALQKDHGLFKQGGIIALENTANFGEASLFYTHPNKESKRYIIPITSQTQHPWLSESLNAIHLEVVKGNRSKADLGTYDFNDLSISTTTIESTTPTSTPTTQTDMTWPNKSALSTNSNSFFANTTTASDDSKSINPVYISLGAGLLLLCMASSLACCLRWVCTKPKKYNPVEDYAINGVINGVRLD